MLTELFYPWVFAVVWSLFGAVAVLLIVRVIYNYTDPNPFGKIGRLGYKVRKLTERSVYPASRLLANFRIDPRLAPIVTLLISLVIAYFLTQIVASTFFVIDGITLGVQLANTKMVIGFILYGLLSILVLFIFIRFLSYWFVFANNTFFAFVARVTDPILNPVRRLIPPVGMFDISAMLVLILISVLQAVVLNLFVRN